MAVKNPSKNKSFSRGNISRAALGAALVGASVFGVVVMLESGSTTSSFAVASREGGAGSALGVDGVAFVELGDSPALDQYLREGEWGSIEGLVLTHPVRPGELLARENFVEPSVRDDGVVTIELSVGAPGWLVPGNRAELWVGPPASENSFSAPFVLSPEVIIDSVTFDDGFASDAATSRVDLRLPRRDIPSVVHAIANRYFLHLTPVG